MGSLAGGGGGGRPRAWGRIHVCCHLVQIAKHLLEDAVAVSDELAGAEACDEAVELRTTILMGLSTPQGKSPATTLTGRGRTAALPS